MPQTWRAPSISAGVSVGDPRCGATKRIGTNLGVSLAFRDELVAAGARLPAPQRRSGQPPRERRIHLKTRFALTPFARNRPAGRQSRLDDPLTLRHAPRPPLSPRAALNAKPNPV
ncbi:hypothetical protein [Roseiarcus sp.]|uniref:hypothetical protein n=1 Tax=Roseiarcus sp. TaxID=1969460 RepID=UPI003C36FA84